jgi:dynein heavy chain
LAQFKGELDEQRWRFLLTGGLELGEKLPELPGKAPWVTAKMWGEVLRLSAIDRFSGLVEMFTDDVFLKQLDKLYGSVTPHIEKLPDRLKFCEDIDKLLVLRTIRPDKIVPGVQ